jgi:simple sugar transport system permease protein
VIILAFLVQTLRIATPYLLAASGGVLSERAGIIALTLEGWMLTSAFCAALGSFYAQSPWVGLLCGVAGGVAAAALHALASIRYRANQVVVGIAINLLAIGTTRFFLRLAFDSSSNSPRVPGFDWYVASGDAASGPVALLASLVNPLVMRNTRARPVAWVSDLSRTCSCCGERLEALRVWASPARVRWAAVLAAGALTSLGGVYLALDQHQFTDNMTAGRGFIALAAVIFGNWRPTRVAVACVLFAAAETFQIQLQGLQLIPSQFVEMIPYVLTIIALAGVVGRAVPPAALGRPTG